VSGEARVVPRADPIKVLWFAKGLGRGGTERILASSVPLLDRDRFEVEVAYLLPWKDALVPEFEGLGIAVHCLDATARGRLTWPLRLRTLVQERGYAIVHTHMPYPAAVARVILSRRSDLSLVHTEHNVWDRFRPLTREANALTLSRNAAVVAVSGAVARSITRSRFRPWTPAPSVEVIYHGIDPEKVRAGKASRVTARAKLGIAENVFVVGTVGNLTAKKDHRTLLEALAFLVPRHSAIHMVIIGDGPLRRDLESLAASLGVADRVTFAGSRADVSELLPALDIFVLSSLYEGFPIALVEAMVAGLACVATEVGGTPELVADRRNGLLVPPASAAALAEVLSELAEDNDLRSALGRQAAHDASKYSMDRAVERLQEIYSEMVAAK
jgi:glycosyltransferase involved in cell wall biosynthesis